MLFCLAGPSHAGCSTSVRLVRCGHTIGKAAFLRTLQHKHQASEVWAYHGQGSFPAGLRQEVHGDMQVLALGQVGVAALAPMAGLRVGGQLLHP